MAGTVKHEFEWTGDVSIDQHRDGVVTINNGTGDILWQVTATVDHEDVNPGYGEGIALGPMQISPDQEVQVPVRLHYTKGEEVNEPQIRLYWYDQDGPERQRWTKGATGKAAKV